MNLSARLDTSRSIIYASDDIFRPRSHGLARVYRIRRKNISRYLHGFENESVERGVGVQCSISSHRVIIFALCKVRNVHYYYVTGCTSTNCDILILCEGLPVAICNYLTMIYSILLSRTIFLAHLIVCN